MVGESELLKLKGKYIRIAHKDLGSTIEIIGNIIKDKWFDYKTFFEKETDMLTERVTFMQNIRLKIINRRN